MTKGLTRPRSHGRRPLTRRQLFKQVDQMARQLHEMSSMLSKAEVPFEHKLWDAEEASQYLGVSKNNFTYNIASSPGFPGYAVLPNSRKRLWRAKDISDWFQKNRGKARKGAL
ncbi:helix-turn-helix domain-containing protein [Laribacter hongkongensis]|uniref:helix-turn-helix domain-containing protein n=1 Tax=Laribacter hongkongensis TaxID=168471 RepID=UPI0004860F16|nr:helix-turn-helix domain-containing protein [Laribacter hongkongensis]MCG9096232.1 helix-turn-helix domain-containing protein [Laribacter hongkongensis]